MNTKKQRTIVLLAILALIFTISLAVLIRPIVEIRISFRNEFPGLFGLGSEIRGLLTITEIESESLVEISHCADCPQVPFGYANNSWEAFKAIVQEGDEIFYFRSGTASWNALAGRQGFALIRKGTIVRTILTLLS